MLNVLHCGDYHLPGQNPTAAIPGIMQNLLHGLNKLNVNGIVLSRNDTIENDTTLYDDGVEIHYIAKRKPRIGSSLVREIPILRKKMKEIRPDIVHAQDPVYAYCAQKENIPCIMTLHGIIWNEALYNLRSKDRKLRIKGIGQKFIYIPLYEKVLSRLKHLIVINKYVTDEMKGRYKGLHGVNPQ